MKRVYTLTGTDINLIERLSGFKLDDKLKAYLIGQYGKGGQNDQFMTIIDSCTDGNLFKCHDCGLCAWDTGDSLLTQIALAILCYNHGELDLEGNHHSVRDKIALKWSDDGDEDIPF